MAGKRICTLVLWIYGSGSTHFCCNSGNLAIYALLSRCRKCRDLRVLRAKKNCESWAPSQKNGISSTVPSSLLLSCFEVLSCESWTIQVGPQAIFCIFNKYFNFFYIFTTKVYLLWNGLTVLSHTQPKDPKYLRKLKLFRKIASSLAPPVSPPQLREEGGWLVAGKSVVAQGQLAKRGHYCPAPTAPTPLKLNLPINLMAGFSN